MEQKRGFVHDMLDLKVLTLFALSLLDGPVPFSTLLEICMQDDGVDYLNLGEAVGQPVHTGHLTEAGDVVSLTPLGREHGAVTWDSLAQPLREKVRQAAEAYKRLQQRQERVRTDIEELADGTFLVKVTLGSPVGDLMHLALPAVSKHQARLLKQSMFDQADNVYAAVLNLLLAHERQEPEDL